jgi:copper homeostasis protein
MPIPGLLMKKRPLLEVCVDSPAGLEAAVSGGADRIELCSALALSGLTPSPGLMALAAEAPVPVYAMIRPHPGDFVYGPRELDTMRREIDAARAAGLAGVVFGATRRTGELDEAALAGLIGHAKGMGTTLHRAFDLTPDLGAALETAVGLGFERVLTSGGEITAGLGAERIAELVEQTAGRIGVMAGAGLNAANVTEVVGLTGVGEVHASCSTPTPTSIALWAEKAAALGFLDGRSRATSRPHVEDLVKLLQLLK